MCGVGCSVVRDNGGHSDRDTLERKSGRPALPQGDEGPRYWAGRSSRHGGKMARDRAGSRAERFSGSDSPALGAAPRAPGPEGFCRHGTDLPFQAKRS